MSCPLQPDVILSQLVKLRLLLIFSFVNILCTFFYIGIIEDLKKIPNNMKKKMSQYSNFIAIWTSLSLNGMKYNFKPIVISTKK